MSQPFLGEIRMFGGNFAPVGWAFCQGQLMPISENPTLFQLIGTTYGGDGQNTFALPNLQSRIPVHVGPNFVLGQSARTESVTLTVSQIPQHNHLVQTSNTPNSVSPTNNVLADEGGTGGTTVPIYSGTTPTQALVANQVGSAGGSQPHDNMVPFLVVNFIISLFGVFPSQS